MSPLPIVSLILGLFFLSALALSGLILLDHLAERRLNRALNPRLRHARQDALQLNLDSLIQELTAFA